MNFKKFLKYSFLGGVVWSGFLVAMGYFYGYLWREISAYIEWIGWAIFGLAIASIAAVSLYKKRESRKLFLKNNNADADTKGII